MSIKIHHGPPGSYKTASAVQWDLAEAVERGDVIITNVRGLTLEKIHAEFDDVPQSVDVIFLDLDKSEDREKIKRWFHWAPKNAFFLWDEAAVCFPKSMRAAEIDDLVYKTPTEASQEGRPHTWEEAWDMHRHYGWNIVLCLVNIKKLRDDIRGAAEMAIKHKNLALMGTFFKGKFLQGWHSAESNGSASDFYQDVSKKMPKDARCWRLYESTKTKEIKDTTAGFNLFKSPKVLFYGGGVLLVIGYAFRDGTPAKPFAIEERVTASAATAQAAKKQPEPTLFVPAAPEVPQVSAGSGIGHAIRHVYNNTAATPIDTVKRVRTEPILKGCVSTEKTCICYTHNGVKLDVPKTYCHLIEKSGFYTEPVQIVEETGLIDEVKDKISDFVKPSFSPLSATTIDEVMLRDEEKNQRYLDNVASRERSSNELIQRSTYSGQVE